MVQKIHTDREPEMDQYRQLVKFDFGGYYYSKTGLDSARKIVLDRQNKNARFKKLVNSIVSMFNAEMQRNGEINVVKVRDIHKKARAGGEKEGNYYKGKIGEYLQENNLLDVPYPRWYPSLTEAIFQEGWGYGGLYEWFYSEYYKKSTSAKVIGDRIYFQDPSSGKMIQMPQQLTAFKKDKIIDMLYSIAVHKKRENKCDALYTSEGYRVQIYDKDVTKPGQSALVFRKYIINHYSFEEQVDYHTIDAESVDLLKAYVAAGPNTAITGAVKTSKTTFLVTLEMYEDDMGEGVMVETDPEIPMHLHKPDAPIIQLLAPEHEDLKGMVKEVMRSDGTRLIMAEARDPVALDTALKMAAKGTRRGKITYHVTDPVEFISEAADEINKHYGNTNFASQALKVAKSFNYIFHFISLENKGQKRLSAIYEIDYDPASLSVKLVPICQYDMEKDDWWWHYAISKRTYNAMRNENAKAAALFDRELKRLSKEKPLENPQIYDLSYIREGMLRGGND